MRWNPTSKTEPDLSVNTVAESLAEDTSSVISEACSLPQTSAYYNILNYLKHYKFSFS